MLLVSSTQELCSTSNRNCRQTLQYLQLDNTYSITSSITTTTVYQVTSYANIGFRGFKRMRARVHGKYSTVMMQFGLQCAYLLPLILIPDDAP